ncbi:MAG: site-2 protease family protein [Clostridia bacterium]|nr:site-2 protease family protein [Clostridia bacterium]
MVTALIVVVAILLFLMVVLIHEFGHFLFAKLNGVKVNEFSIGMGPKLFGFNGKETVYSFRLLPIGGYCAMEGEDAESDSPTAFGNKKVWQRLLIVAAGAIFNIILGLLFMFIIDVQEPVYTSTTIATFTEDAASEKSGLQVNDKIVKVNNYAVFCATDLSFALQTDPGNDGVMDITVVRDGKKVKLENITFDTFTDESSGRPVTQIDFKVYGLKRTFGRVFSQTFLDTVAMTRVVYKSLAMLLTGQAGFGDLAGPVGTASVIGQVAKMGFKESFAAGVNNILNIMALITVNLGVFNLLPLPALDGGRIIFLLIEAVRGKPINPKYEGWVHAAGLALLLLLMVAVTFNDILRLIRGG